MFEGFIIADAIRDKCSEESLIRWCKSWGFTLEDFRLFLQLGAAAFDADKMKRIFDDPKE